MQHTQTTNSPRYMHRVVWVQPHTKYTAVHTHILGSHIKQTHTTYAMVMYKIHHSTGRIYYAESAITYKIYNCTCIHSEETTLTCGRVCRPLLNLHIPSLVSLWTESKNTPGRTSTHHLVSTCMGRYVYKGLTNLNSLPLDSVAPLR